MKWIIESSTQPTIVISNIPDWSWLLLGRDVHTVKVCGMTVPELRDENAGNGTVLVCTWGGTYQIGMDHPYLGAKSLYWGGVAIKIRSKYTMNDFLWHKPS